jgi:hypothetical protein
MILKNIARIICLGVAGASGWTVFINLEEIFEGWVPPVSGIVVFLVVYSLLYLPLARHIAEAISDRMTVAMHRGRHIKSGTGLDSIPDAPPAINCTVCGGPGGPICESCDQKMSSPPRPFS